MDGGLKLTCPPRVAGLKGSRPRCRKTPCGGGLFIVPLLSIKLQFCTMVMIASAQSGETFLKKKSILKFPIS